MKRIQEQINIEAFGLLFTIDFEKRTEMIALIQKGRCAMKKIVSIIWYSKPIRWLLGFIAVGVLLLHWLEPILALFLPPQF